MTPPTPRSVSSAALAVLVAAAAVGLSASATRLEPARADGNLSTKEFGRAKRQLEAALAADEAVAAIRALEEIVQDDSWRAAELLIEVGVRAGDLVIHEAARTGLATIRDDRARRKMVDLIRRSGSRGDWRAKAVVCRALARRGDALAREGLVHGLADRVGAVRRIALDGLARRQDPDVVEALIGALERVEAEAEGGGRLGHFELRRELHRLTARGFTDAAGWRGFWDEQGAGFVFGPLGARPKAAPGPLGPAFFGERMASDRLVVATSLPASMATADLLPVGVVPDEADRHEPIARAERLRAELRRSLGELDRRARFAVVAASDALAGGRGRAEPVWVSSAELASAKPSAVTEVDEALGRLAPAGEARRLTLAIERALGIAEADTIIVVADGPPTDAATAAAFAKRIDFANRFRRVRIHGVALADGAVSFLESIAERNGGTVTRAR